MGPWMTRDPMIVFDFTILFTETIGFLYHCLPNWNGKKVRNAFKGESKISYVSGFRCVLPHHFYLDWKVILCLFTMLEKCSSLLIQTLSGLVSHVQKD
jgi:hypothetical protein